MPGADAVCRSSASTRAGSRAATRGSGRSSPPRRWCPACGWPPRRCRSAGWRWASRRPPARPRIRPSCLAPVYGVDDADARRDFGAQRWGVGIEQRLDRRDVIRPVADTRHPPSGVAPLVITRLGTTWTWKRAFSASSADRATTAARRRPVKAPSSSGSTTATSRDSLRWAGDGGEAFGDGGNLGRAGQVGRVKSGARGSDRTVAEPATSSRLAVRPH